MCYQLHVTLLLSLQAIFFFIAIIISIAFAIFTFFRRHYPNPINKIVQFYHKNSISLSAATTNESFFFHSFFFFLYHAPGISSFKHSMTSLCIAQYLLNIPFILRFEVALKTITTSEDC